VKVLSMIDAVAITVLTTTGLLIILLFFPHMFKDRHKHKLQYLLDQCS